jgi:putative peptidoglycan lipid II flippase
MSRLLLLSPILFAISNTLGGLLVSLERFFGYGLSPLLYNLGIIGGVFFIEPFGPLGLAVGVVIGALLHLAVRFVALMRSGFRPSTKWNLKDRNFRQVIILMVPRMAGQPIEQLTFFLFTALASSLATGSITILNFARNFQSVPVSVFGIAFATAAFSSLSRKAALGDRKGLVGIIRETGTPLLAITAASALFYILAGRFVVDLLLGGGEFGPDAVRATARLLAVFAIAIPAESFMHILVRSFYALKDTWTPVLVRVPGIGFIYLLAVSLMPTMGLNALGLSYVIAITTEALVLGLLLRAKLRRLPNQALQQG